MGRRAGLRLGGADPGGGRGLPHAARVRRHRVPGARRRARGRGSARPDRPDRAAGRGSAAWPSSWWRATSSPPPCTRCSSSARRGSSPYPLPDGELAARNRPPARAGHRRAPWRTAAGRHRRPQRGGAAGARARRRRRRDHVRDQPWPGSSPTRGTRPGSCLMDLNFQFGSVATYLRPHPARALVRVDRGRRADRFRGLHAGPRAVPGPAEGADRTGRTWRRSRCCRPRARPGLIEAARTNFDYVVVDMPMAVTQWTGTFLDGAHLYLPVLELDLRSAENALRFKPRRAVGGPAGPQAALGP